jgi:hypothetical protein
MDTYDSQPEKGRATGAQSRRRGNNENSDTEQILDRALQGNISRLIGRQRSSAEVWEVFEITSYFVVRTADQQWRYYRTLGGDLPTTTALNRTSRK